MKSRPQTVREELANAMSHGIGVLMALAAAPVLVGAALREGHTATLAGALTFAVTMVLLYLSSTLYHATPPSAAKSLRAELDHVAIFLFIAGSYTPFALGVLKGPWGWTLLGLVWGLALLGILLRVRRRLNHPLLATGLYLAMGWLVVLAAIPLVQAMGHSGLIWLLAGGVAYSAGTIFYLTDARLRFGHFIWHLFVMTGTTCHVLAVLCCLE